MVKLVAITPNAEQLIVDCARVSNPANQGKPAGKLIGYLIDHEHWSPFEMANMVLEITTSRAISAQIIRHRSFSFQEFSQRYAEVQDFAIHEARRQDATNRQNSINDMDYEAKVWFGGAQFQINNMALDLYDVAVNHYGIAKECARFLLPLSTETTLYMNGTIRSWIHYIQLRTGNGTQQEHMDVANECKRIFCDEVPYIAQAVGFH